MSERWYDEEIAPVLLELSRKCQSRGISFISVVEYESGQRGRTSFIADNAGLATRMIDICARADTNVDQYVISLMRYCREHGIPTDSSVVLNRLDSSRP